MDDDFIGILTTNNRHYFPEDIAYINERLKPLSIEDRAMLLGSIIEESGGDPYAKQKGSKYQGLIQWDPARYTPKSKNRQKEIDNQVQQILNTIDNVKDQESWHHGGNNSGYDTAKDAHDVYRDTKKSLAERYRALSLGYVRPKGGEKSYKNRLNVVKQVYQRLGGIAPPLRAKPVPYQPQKFEVKEYHFPMKFSEGGNMKKDWSSLSYKEKADIMKVAVANGLTNIADIKEEYNKFAEGGDKKSKKKTNTADSDYYDYMEKLAKKKAKDWGENPDDTLLRMLNDNEYNYRAFWDNDRENALGMLTADPEAHFTDIAKTVYHPTFSNESMYSGQTSDYNPRATVGGNWMYDNNTDYYVPSRSQFLNGDFNLDKTRNYLRSADPGVMIDLRNASPSLIETERSRGQIFDKGGLMPDPMENHVASLYQGYIDRGIPEEAALELVNQKVAEKGWKGWVSGDNKKFSNMDDFLDHTVEYHKRMYPETLKSKDFNQFFNGLEKGKYKYNPYPDTYKKHLLLTRPGVRKRINKYRATQGLPPLAFVDTPYNTRRVFQNYILPQNNAEPLFNYAAQGGNLYANGGKKTNYSKENAAKVMNYLMSKGVSESGAAAITGTLQAESALNPAIHAQMVGDTGEGLAQWTGSRKKIFWKTLEKIEPGAQKKYKNIVNVPLERQLDVVLAERPDVIKAISNARDVNAATDIMLRAYENGGGNVNNAASINQMNRIYGKWNNDYNTQMKKRVGNARKLLGLNYDPASYIPDQFYTDYNNSLADTVALAGKQTIIMQDPATSYKPPVIESPAVTVPQPKETPVVYDEKQEAMDNIQKFNAIMGLMGQSTPFQGYGNNTSNTNNMGILSYINALYGA